MAENNDRKIIGEKRGIDLKIDKNILPLKSNADESDVNLTNGENLWTDLKNVISEQIEQNDLHVYFAVIIIVLFIAYFLYILTAWKIKKSYVHYVV
jgi:hypothetical protein